MLPHVAAAAHVARRVLRAVLASFAALVASPGAAGEPIQPIPAAAPQDPARVALGRRLFHEPRLSSTDRVSCASCHDLRRGGVDHRERSIGVGGARTALNAPTVFNAALNFRQFWDGRADTLEEQVDVVIRSAVEMGSSWPEVLRKLSSDASYRSAFAAAYPDGITQANVQNAIATFERTLLTPASRFDRWLQGDASALSADEKRGYAKFKQYGCAACHQGVNVGGNMFQRFGVVGDYWRGRAGAQDAGRYAVTKDERDRFVFKVPSLRNVALTAPYLHDGSAQTLEEVVDVMFRYQLGRVAPADDKRAIVRFLHALSGRWEDAR